MVAMAIGALSTAAQQRRLGVPPLQEVTAPESTVRGKEKGHPGAAGTTAGHVAPWQKPEGASRHAPSGDTESHEV